MARSKRGRGSESHRQGHTHGTAREARRVAARWTPRPAGPQHRAPTLPLCTAGPGAATGPPLSLILFAFLKTLFLQSGFKLTEKLRRYGDSPPISTHVQPLPLSTFLPKSRLLLQNYRNFQLNTCSCNERPHFTASTIARYGIWLSYGQWELSIRALQTFRSFCSKEGVPSLFPSFLFLADWDVSETEPIDGNCVLKLAQQQKKEVWFSDICEAIISAQTRTGVKK